MSEIEELRRFGNAVVRSWERLGECEAEFAPDYDPPACNEYREALDTAIVNLNRIINEHALVASAGRPPRDERAGGAGR